MPSAPVPLARRCWIRGRVQGVSFRASTARQAGSLGLTGYARNLDDGRVEVFACGAPADLDKLVQWLHRGPLLARVDEVRVEAADLPDPLPGAFTIA